MDYNKLNKIKDLIKTYPNEDHKNLLKNKPWWIENHSKVNDYLSNLITNTQLVANPNDQKEVDNMLLSLNDILIRIPNKTNLIIRKMAIGQCHDNSFRLLLRDNIKEMHSGYALSNDGLWRHHSWCIDKDDNIIETTSERLVYVTCTITDKVSMMKEVQQYFIKNIKAKEKKERKLFCQEMIKESEKYLEQD